MESITEKIETTTLILKVEEREWLKGLMQNPINGLSESPQDETMRRKFWSALGGATMRTMEDDDDDDFVLYD